MSATKHSWIIVKHTIFQKKYECEKCDTVHTMFTDRPSTYSLPITPCEEIKNG